MRNWKSFIVGSILAGINFVWPKRIMAQALQVPENENDVVTLKGLEAIFNNVVAIAVGIAGLVLFVMLIMGGVQFITSGGEAEAAAKARKTLTYAVLGLGLLVGAYLILRLLEVFTGVQLTIFRIYYSG